MNKSIDLGMDMKECGPGCPCSLNDSKMSDKMYPCFHYSGKKELGLPIEGEMTITFKRKTSTSTEREDGSHWYECTIEVQEIKSVDGEEVSPPTARNNGTEAALDALAQALDAWHHKAEEKERELGEAEEGEEEEENNGE